MIQREFTAERLNAILNHEAVRPWVAPGTDAMDVTPQVADRRNILLMGEHGGCFFIRLMPGVYEVHTQVLPSGRGAWVRALSEACALFMFTRTDAYEIMTRVPEGHVAAKAGALAQGFQHEFTREKGYVLGGKTVDVYIYGLRIQNWASRAPNMIDRGRWLHDRMQQEADRLGIADAGHDDDENHNRYAGITFEMARGGQLGKAIAFYNRWVSLARHFRAGVPSFISLISEEPPIIRFDLGLMKLVGDDIEIVREG